MNTLHRLLQARITQYEHAHNKTISSPAIAQMLSVMLYYRRYDTHNLLEICLN
jgi:20S proteasome subunit beta 6